MTRTHEAPQRTCLRCTKRFARDRAESFDPTAEVCQCRVPIPSLDGKTFEGHPGVNMKRVRDYEYNRALGRVVR